MATRRLSAIERAVRSGSAPHAAPAAAAGTTKVRSSFSSSASSSLLPLLRSWCSAVPARLRLLSYPSSSSLRPTRSLRSLLPRAQVGIVGYGLIGRSVHEMIDADPNNGIEVVFVHDTIPAALEGLGDLALPDLSEFESRGADLVVEMAYASFSSALSRWPVRSMLRRGRSGAGTRT